MTTTTYPTFEQWIDDNFPNADRNNADNAAALRKVYDNDRVVAENAPTVIPPCPSWCVLKPGHDYASAIASDLDYVRTHTSSTTARASVDLMEHNDGRGTVTLDEPTVFVYVEADLDVQGAVGLSDELRSAAELLRTVKAGQ